MGGLSYKKYRKDKFRDGDPCFYCRRPMTTANSIQGMDNPGLVCTTEHYYYPQSKGGTNEHYNLRFSCYRCNNLRGNIYLPIFEEFAKTVIKPYPNVSTILLRATLRQFIETLAEVAIKNKRETRKALSIALLSLLNSSMNANEDKKK